jgi:hypothetical protein
MRIQMEPSDHIVSVDGVLCRVWNGVTEDDRQVFVFVHRIASREELEGLTEVAAPVVSRVVVTE